MKLWLLRPVETDAIAPNGKPCKRIPAAWEPWYDKAFGFVVRAESEEAARALAHADGGDESRGDRAPWLDPQQSICVELTEQGTEEVVVRDFASA